MSVDEKIGLTYEDIADVNMAYSLFDQDDQGKIDLESLETALQQICEGDDGSTIIPPIHRLRRYGDFVTLDSLVDETLVNHEDFDSGKGVRKIFRLFDVENKGWITRDNLFEAIDALSELSMIDEETAKTLGLAMNQLPDEIDESMFAKLLIPQK